MQIAAAHRISKLILLGNRERNRVRWLSLLCSGCPVELAIGGALVLGHKTIRGTLMA